MATRSYNQACSVGNFLDHLGSRWVLLIVRDLLIGPRRFNQLLEGLPGIGPNRLSDRLSDLQDMGIVEKSSATSYKDATYNLTEKGWALEPVILGMARWGLEYLPNDFKDKPGRPDLLVVAFRAVFNPSAAKDIFDTYEFHVGETIFHVEINDGQIEAGLGQAKEPAFLFKTDGETFDQIVSGDLTTAAAEKKGALEIEGDRKAFERFLSIFGGI